MPKPQLFFEASSTELEARVAEFWEFSTGLPMATRSLFCGACGHSELLYKRWHFFRRYKKGTALPARCDVHFKCTRCSMVQVHGVAMSEEQYNTSPFLRDCEAPAGMEVPETFMIRRRDAVQWLVDQAKQEVSV